MLKNVNRLDSGEYECLDTTSGQISTVKLTVYGRVDDQNVLDNIDIIEKKVTKVNTEEVDDSTDDLIKVNVTSDESPDVVLKRTNYQAYNSRNLHTFWS